MRQNADRRTQKGGLPSPVSQFKPWKSSQNPIFIHSSLPLRGDVFYESQDVTWSAFAFGWVPTSRRNRATAGRQGRERPCFRSTTQRSSITRMIGGQLGTWCRLWNRLQLQITNYLYIGGAPASWPKNTTSSVVWSSVGRYPKVGFTSVYWQSDESKLT